MHVITPPLSKRPRQRAMSHGKHVNDFRGHEERARCDNNTKFGRNTNASSAMGTPGGSPHHATLTRRAEDRWPARLAV